MTKIWFWKQRASRGQRRQSADLRPPCASSNRTLRFIMTSTCMQSRMNDLVLEKGHYWGNQEATMSTTTLLLTWGAFITKCCS